MMLYLGLLAGVLQLVGYLLYVRDEEIEPNPVTWLMFAYGTMLLTFSSGTARRRPGARAPRRLQQHGALRGGSLLASCAPGGILAVWPQEWWPDDWRDRASFQADLALTALYLAAAALTSSRWIGEGARETAVTSSWSGPT